MSLWLVTFTRGDDLLGGAIADEATIISALGHLDDLGLVPDAADVMNIRLPDGTGLDLLDRWLEPGEVTELLNGLERS